MSRSGRKPVSDPKKPTSVSILTSLDKAANDNRIDKGRILETGILLALGTDPEEIEARKLRDDISLLESELGPKKARLVYLQERIAARKKQETELRLEEDCGSWYLRMLLQDNQIQVIRPVPVNVPKLFDEYRLKWPEEFEGAVSDGATIKFISTPMHKIGTALKNRGFVTDSRWLKFTYAQPSPRMLCSDNEFRTKFKIAFDSAKFLADLLSGNVSASLPLVAFQQYPARITSDEVKREVKSRMLPEYLQVNVEVKDTEVQA